MEYIVKVSYTDGTVEEKTFYSREEFHSYIHNDNVSEVEILSKREL